MIELSNVSKTYRMGDAQVHALRGVSLRIEPGEFVAIMGPSGSGKSTLLHILGLLDVPDSGSYRLQGREVSALGDDELARIRNEEFGFVFQQFNLLPRATALENAAMPLLYSRMVADSSRPRALLERVGLADRLHHRPNQLSGGQQQRVAIARALANRPRVIFADEPTGNLDSASAHDLMRLLSRLNEEGLTLVLVTHERDIADYANRIIHMRDGAIQSEERRLGLRPFAEAPHSVEKPEAEPVRHLPGRAMITYARLAGRALWTHKVRSFLSMLGILIGVASVIAMLGIGAGAKEAIRRQFSHLGSNVLIVRPSAWHTGAVRLQAGQVSRLTPEDARAIAERVPGVRYVSATVSTRAQAEFGARNWNTEVTGVEPDHQFIRAMHPTVGRYVTDEDLRTRSRVAVVGRTVVRELFQGRNPVGEDIRIDRILFKVVGVLPEKGSSPWRDRDDVIIIPLTTAMFRLAGRETVDAIEMEIADASLIPRAQREAVALLRARLKTPPHSADPVQVQNMAEMLAALTETSRTMSMLLASIAAISLVVGGIGIMNIMLVSVTERVREIGIRKAVGARRLDILGQFLVEAVTTSLVGGTLGIGLGAAIAMVLSHAFGWAIAITGGAVALAFGCSAATGLIFGIWPARKAALLNPIDALRYE